MESDSSEGSPLVRNNCISLMEARAERFKRMKATPSPPLCTPYYMSREGPLFVPSLTFPMVLGPHWRIVDEIDIPKPRSTATLSEAIVDPDLPRSPRTPEARVRTREKVCPGAPSRPIKKVRRQPRNENGHARMQLLSEENGHTRMQLLLEASLSRMSTDSSD